MSAVPDFTTLDLGDGRPGRDDAHRCPSGEPWVTPEQIPVKPLYTEADLAGPRLPRHRARASPPYLRGPYPTMYVNQPWTIRQYAGFSTAEESNAFYRRNLAAGQKGLSVAFDLATHRGYDCDHPRVTGDVGMAGVAIDSILDMRTLFDGIPLDQMTVSMTMNGAVLPVLALYVVAAEEQGVAPEQLTGTIQNDILKEFMVRNTYIYPPEPSMRIICDIFAFTSQRDAAVQLDLDLRLPHAGGRGDAGPRARATPSPTASSTSGPARRSGLDVDAFAPRLSFFWAIGMNFFMEVAKLRAARLLWARLVKDQFGAEEPQVAVAAHPLPDLGLVAHRAGRLQQRRAHLRRGDGRDPGAHPDLHTNALDEALALPTDFSARIARNTQLFLQQESGTTPGHRPVGRLLLRRAAHRTTSPQRAWQHIEEVEAAGGMAKAIEAGIPKMRIEEAAARTQARIDSGQQPVIGVNRYPVDEDEPIEVLQGRQRRGARPARSPSSSGCAPSATRTPPGPRCSGSRRPPAPVRRHARHQPARARDRRRPGRWPPSARCRPRWRRSSAATPPRSVRSGACTAPRRGRTRRSDEAQALVEQFEQRAGPPPAHPRRQDGPGRPRPRPEGDRHGVRRPRLRRRRGPAVPDARRGRPPGRRGRRARRRGQLAGRRAPHPGAGPARASSTRSAART